MTQYEKTKSWILKKDKELSRLYILLPYSKIIYLALSVVTTNHFFNFDYKCSLHWDIQWQECEIMKKAISKDSLLNKAQF